MTKVSIILTTHNKARYTVQAIGSVMAQTYRNFELIIIDDHSTDGTYEMCSALLFQGTSLMKTDLPKHSMNQPYVNRYAHNINLAFTKSSGEYITYLCDDDLYLPWRIELMARLLDNEPDISVVYGLQQLLHEDSNGNVMMGMVRPNIGRTFSAAQQIDHSSVMHRRGCFEAVGGWDETAPMRYGDAHFWTRLNSAGYAFVPLPVDVPTDCHRYNVLSVTHKIDHPVYPPYDDLGNRRLVNNAVDPVYSAVDK